MNGDVSDIPSALLLWATEGVLGGLVLSHIALWMSHMRYKIHVSELYVSKPEILKIERDISDMRNDMQKSLKDILMVVYELRGQQRTKE